MTHIQQRLAERNITIEAWELDILAARCGDKSTAVLLARLEEHKGCEGAYRTREESNGNLVILIVREGKPITVMYRRDDQPLTPEALHVRQVVELVS